MNRLIALLFFLSSLGAAQIPLTGAGLPKMGGAALPTLTLVQHPRVLSASGTTAAITLSSTTVAGNTLVFCANFTADNVTMVSVDKGGTLIPVVSTSGGDQVNGAHPCGYIVAATAATTPITVTLSASTSSNIEMWEIHPSSASPALALDCANSLVVPSGVSPVAPGCTLTGGNDAMFEACATGSSCTAITSPYSTNADFFSGNGWAVSLNTVSGASPTWTVAPAGQTSMAMVALGFSPTAGVNEGYQSAEGTNNTSASESTLRASMHGWTGCQWGVAGTGAAMKFQTTASQGLLNATSRLYGDGAVWPSATSTTGLEFLTSTVQSYITCDTQTNGGTTNGFPYTSVSMAGWYRSDFPDNNTGPTIDIFQIIGFAGSDFATIQLSTNGGSTKKCLTLESNAGPAHSACHDITTATWYWMDVEYNKTGTMVMKVYDATGSLLFSDSVAAAGTTLPSRFAFGQSASSTPTTGFKLWFDSIRISLAGGTITP